MGQKAPIRDMRGTDRKAHALQHARELSRAAHPKLAEIARAKKCGGKGGKKK